jgi:hypothetical protein
MQARERAHILRICQATAWKIKGPDGAASKLGNNPGTLYARMKKPGIQRPRLQYTAILIKRAKTWLFWGWTSRSADGVRRANPFVNVGKCTIASILM